MDLLLLGKRSSLASGTSFVVFGAERLHNPDCGSGFQLKLLNSKNKIPLVFIAS
jgi:hypothetical protein